MKEWIIGIDQSTQGTKAVLIDRTGCMKDKTYLPHEQIISLEGWVSHDGETIWKNTKQVVKDLLVKTGIHTNQIAAIGISNQRETTIAWDARTGEPVCQAIVWQCSRGKEVTDPLAGSEFASYVLEKTGIPLSPYFPAAKAGWIMKHVPRAQKLAEQDDLRIGTIDSYLVDRMTEGKVFKTDYSNASRTQLLDIGNLCWDSRILGTLGIPESAMAQVEFSDGDFGETTLDGVLDEPVPIAAVMGDSHAALFGQGCLKPGMAKATYGTGSSIMMNIGPRMIRSTHGLVTSLAWGQNGQVDYVLEGNINYSGAVITWLKDDIKLIENAAETEKLAREANPADETYLVPAFTGLGAPYWMDDASAVICGMRRTTGKNELIKAALSSIAFQVRDIVHAMEEDAGLKLSELRVDGGPTANGFLMQLQSDLTDTTIRVPQTEELSAIGAAMLAGIAEGAIEEEVLQSDRTKKVYLPSMDPQEREKKLEGWHRAIRMASTK